MAKKIQSGGFLGQMLGNVRDNFGEKATIKLAVSLTEDVLPKLANKATSSILAKSEGKKKSEEL